ncbi:hypothetical protein CAP37_03800 [Hydrogenophaga sp. IBVHS1]|nr:hypothetical protein CAP37_03800 [Hydrogenophaga sp. IBVHS1]
MQVLADAVLSYRFLQTSITNFNIRAVNFTRFLEAPMRSALEYCIFGIALFVAVVAAFHLALALGFGEPVWEPLATMASAIGVMGLLGLERTDAELERDGQSTTPTESAPNQVIAEQSMRDQRVQLVGTCLAPNQAERMAP